jgi:hypothetical protein
MLRWKNAWRAVVVTVPGGRERSSPRPPPVRCEAPVRDFSSWTTRFGRTTFSLSEVSGHELDPGLSGLPACNLGTLAGVAVARPLLQGRGLDHGCHRWTTDVLCARPWDRRDHPLGRARESLRSAPGCSTQSRQSCPGEDRQFALMRRAS